MVRLIPRDERFYELFIEDASNLAQVAHRLVDMVESYDRLDERVSEIQALEKRGDELDAEIQARLERAFVTPFDREDIHELVVHLDDVVDGVQAAAETFVIYAIRTPPEESRRMAAILAEQAEHLLEALRKLEHPKTIAPSLAAIHDLEHEADGLSRKAIARLFRDETDAIEVIRVREVIRTLESAIDDAEDAGEVIERILAKGH
jgi:predicted phosphate transport protein (TIGR00153 family)